MYTPIPIPPGVVKTDSQYGAKGRWFDADKIHFIAGRPEKWGGWEKRIATQLVGICRGAHGWDAATGSSRFAFGTQCKLYVLQGESLINVTPTRETGTLGNDPFTTTNLSAVVTVADTAHGFVATGDYAKFSGATAVGGITIDGEYTITSIVDENSYTITHTSAATSSATGGGAAVAYEYEIACGRVDQTVGVGYGTGPYGKSTYGTARAEAQGILLDPRIWHLDDYGDDLVAAFNGSTVYEWDSSGSARATPITNAPTDVRGVFVSGERFIMALRDGMIVQWPDVDDTTDWTPSAINTANSRTLQEGSRLVAGTRAAQGINLVWSNTACYEFQHNPGSLQVYDSRILGRNAGLIGAQAFAEIEGVVYWMSANNFMMYAGSISPIPNAEDIRDWVLRNLNSDQRSKVVCAHIPRHRKLLWIFPTTGTEPAVYVELDIDSYHWANGTLARTAATQEMTLDGRPVLVGTDGYIYTHELVGDTDADGAAMKAYITAGLLDIGDGALQADLNGFLPDMPRQTGDVILDVFAREYPRGNDFEHEREIIQEQDDQADLRLGGRQFYFTLTSNVVGGDFRLGDPNVDIEPDTDKR